MSLAIVSSRAQLGTDAPPVTIEVFLSGGLPSFAVVGMPETAVRESKDRVRGALISSGFAYPQQRITVSLAPADMRKTGGRFDLAIALGIIAAQKELRSESLGGIEFYGELSLNGDVRRVPGLLPAALRAAEAGRPMIVPRDNGAEAALAATEVRPVSTLLEVTAHLGGHQPIDPLPMTIPPDTDVIEPDIRDVRGQQKAKRALEIAAAGGHNLLFIGPPGTGKSMLARRLPGILPAMSDDESLETAAVDSVLGRPIDLERWRQRPFRAPHHTASPAAIVGGGSSPRPGEISRAHNGVLFLDELPEFRRDVLEVLREPLETGTITISRAAHQADFPARFQLVAAMNPCPCGYLGDEGGDCHCSSDRVAAYQGRISGPLLDRVDLHVEVRRPPGSVLRDDAPRGESSALVRERVERARAVALKRGGRSNAALTGDGQDSACTLCDAGVRVLEKAVDRFRLSVRARHRVLRVSRTIADLAGEERIASPHVAEALSLRALDARRGRSGSEYSDPRL